MEAYRDDVLAQGGMVGNDGISLVAWVSCLRPEPSTVQHGVGLWTGMIMQEDHHSSLLVLGLGFGAVFVPLQRSLNRALSS